MSSLDKERLFNDYFVGVADYLEEPRLSILYQKINWEKVKPLLTEATTPEQVHSILNKVFEAAFSTNSWWPAIYLGLGVIAMMALVGTLMYFNGYFDGWGESSPSQVNSAEIPPPPPADTTLVGGVDPSHLPEPISQVNSAEELIRVIYSTIEQNAGWMARDARLMREVGIGIQERLNTYPPDAYIPLEVVTQMTKDAILDLPLNVVPQELYMGQVRDFLTESISNYPEKAFSVTEGTYRELLRGFFRAIDEMVVLTHRAPTLGEAQQLSDRVVQSHPLFFTSPLEPDLFYFNEIVFYGGLGLLLIFILIFFGSRLFKRGKNL